MHGSRVNDNDAINLQCPLSMIDVGNDPDWTEIEGYFIKKACMDSSIDTTICNMLDKWRRQDGSAFQAVYGRAFEAAKTFFQEH